MLMWTSQHENLHRRWWLAIALAANSLVRAEDLPKNALRILSAPAVNESQSAELAPPDDAIPLIVSANPKNNFQQEPEMLLVSDGWEPRPGSEKVLELKSPTRAINSNEQQPSGHQPQSPSTATSTLKFLASDAAAVKSIAPATKPIATTQTTVLPPQKLYGPGTPPKQRTPDAFEKKQRAEALELLPTAAPEATAVPIVNPEQNEPTTEKRTTRIDDSERTSTPEISAVPLKDAEPTVEETTDKADNQNVAPVPQRVQVRDLKLRIDGTVVPPLGTRGTQAAPISKRSDARQSIGDEPSEVADQANLSGDRIGPKGDLILAIGMADEKNRVTGTTARLRVPIERTLNYYWSKPEDAEERTHWGMFHAMMIYDKDTQIISDKRRYNAVAWMAGNNACRNQLLFEQDSRGINVKTGIGLQGHQAQMLAMCGLIDVPAAYPLYVGRNKFTVDDVLRREMLVCKSGDELTFTLIGLSHYIDSDTQWISDDGQDWDFERVIQEELSQPIVGAACGGTHRLMGFAHSLRRRRAEGKPITGQWVRSDKYVKDFIAYTWQLQNSDGSMSTAWYEKSEDNGKIDRKIQTTGHMVEFLLTALPDEQLQSPQMLRSISFLVNTLYEERGHDWQVGPKGHALRALAMYYRRVFGRPDPWRPVAVARHNSTHTR